MKSTPTMDKRGYSLLAGAFVTAVGAATAGAPQPAAASGCCDYEYQLAEWQCDHDEPGSGGGVCYFSCHDFGEDGCNAFYDCCC